MLLHYIGDRSPRNLQAQILTHIFRRISHQRAGVSPPPVFRMSTHATDSCHPDDTRTNPQPSLPIPKRCDDLPFYNDNTRLVQTIARVSMDISPEAVVAIRSKYHALKLDHLFQLGFTYRSERCFDSRDIR